MYASELFFDIYPSRIIDTCGIGLFLPACNGKRTLSTRVEVAITPFATITALKSTVLILETVYAKFKI